ncbi:LacI family DNA-binding transcriptional regulator [Streptomyces sp. DSM 44915]|uniref:LacI family DNA-binding transcriptional regulator n=1 Tax=Streptomyces chisholmiae TaxID=3075540 RepID=A0ABU2JXJ3_9ACTN|nr:LacI family DNA-binding transcriptional regulator [Streptomyces sp. DSM 44915]MDT0269718.1 LacI family DNA-binding transcriptional regulator [Streptomyces sp. DSM 44915]
MSEKVTLRDVAAHAGVSRATASLVLRGTGRVAPQTRERVLASMAELGYIYDQVAASLRTRHARVVGVVVTNIGNPNLAEVILGLEAEFRGAGYLPLLTVTRDDAAQQDEAVAALQEHKIAGLAMVPATGTDPALPERLTASGLGHVFVTRYVEGARTSFVGTDDVRGGELAGQHLLEHGCRRLAYLGGPAWMLSRHERLAGVRRAMAAAGRAEEPIDLPSETSGGGGLAAGRELLDRGEVPDGVVCHSDSVAFGLYRALRERGVDAGATRVIGYDDIPGAALWEPPLTSVAVHGRRLGQRAARLLLDRMTDPYAAPVVHRAEPELAVRRSCGCHTP